MRSLPVARSLPGSGESLPVVMSLPVARSLPGVWGLASQRKNVMIDSCNDVDQNARVMRFGTRHKCWLLIGPFVPRDLNAAF